MPAIQKITKEMIQNKAIKIIKTKGIEALNVRNIAKELNCSTQPIMYHYKNMDLLKEELYHIIDDYHSEFLMKESKDNNPLLNIGLQYIKFAVEEKNLFKFLFQNNKFNNYNFSDLLNSEELNFIIDEIIKESNISKEQAKLLFQSLAISAHGLASFLANNSMKYDEQFCIEILEKTFNNLI